ncbi:hypothetical protein EUX98_g6373 [Antrodiella citrinella]|uniref:Cupin type-2 domain-containing protein n=1 Tax=Antrodiella citrinella TaxID=2447956 RepID=A0A4S4MR11_9APHY|nr:hypothetical protein EUX98_g6373 [Antrodiella citrinella]
MTPSPLPDIRRVVTGHNANGEATIIRDEVLQPPDVAPIRGVFLTEGFPVQNDAELKSGAWEDSIASYKHLAAQEGAVSRIYDLPPGHVIPTHRTQTLDIGLVMKGSVTLSLENGETTILKVGDVIVQRGTLHGWKNDSSEWCRVLFVVLAAQPIEVNGKVLPESLPKAE